MLSEQSEPSSTPCTGSATTTGEFLRARARSIVYNVLAEVLIPPTEETHARLSSGQLVSDLQEAAEVLGLDAAALVGELSQHQDADLPTLVDLSMVAFGPAVGSHHPPYSIEHDRAGKYRKEHELADIAGYYLAWRVKLRSDLPERVDHFGIEADFLAFMALKEAYALCEAGPEEVEFVRDTALRFINHYVAPGVRSFHKQLMKANVNVLYVEAAALLLALLEEQGATELARRRVVTLPVFE